MQLGAHQHHETVFQAWLYCLDSCAIENLLQRRRIALCVLVEDEAHIAALGNGVDDHVGVIQQLGLQHAARLSRLLQCHEAAPACVVAQRLRCAVSQDLALVHHIHLCAAFGLV